ncbi:MAG: DUF6612 family protein [Sporomusaceae bacterium]|nr:DUF6612 family protein [Sporomusaceae bacterium]
MRGFWQKLNWRAAFVWGLLLLAVNNPAALAAEELTPGKAYLDSVYQTMLTVDSVHYDMTIKAETPRGNVKIAINGDAQDSPLTIKNRIHIDYRDAGENEKAVELAQYIETQEKDLVMYLLHNGAWVKQLVAVDADLFRKRSAPEKAADRLVALQLIKSVEFKRETPSYRYMEVTLDAVQVSDQFGAAVSRKNTQDKNMLRVLAVTRLGILAAGDIKYMLKVDKAANRVAEIEMDLTEPFRKGARLFLDVVDPRERHEIEAFLSQSTLRVQINYSNYNQTGVIEVPQEVREQARELKPGLLL